MLVPLLLLRLLSLLLHNTPLKWEESLHLYVNYLKPGCFSLAKGKQIKENVSQAQTSNFQTFLTMAHSKKYILYLYVYIHILYHKGSTKSQCKMYIDYNESFMKQYSSIPHAVLIVFSTLICFTSLKILVRPSKMISQTTKEDPAVWKNTAPGRCYMLRTSI